VGKGSYLGIGVQEITSERAKTLKLPEERGIEVTRVEDDSPASKAGLKDGDVVLEYNGHRVEGAEQFVRLVRETPAGRQAKLLISRNGATQTITVTVGERKAPTVLRMDPKWQQDMEKFQSELWDNLRFRIEMPDLPGAMMSWRSGMLGVEAESLTSQLAEFFGVKEGVLVRSVTKGSAAEKAGIKAGDVITKVDSAKVTSPGEITRTIRALGSKRTFPVTVVRNRQEMALNVTLEEPAPRPGPAPRRIQAAPRVERRLLPRPRLTSIQSIEL
jgi:serine protease Do